MTIKSNTYKDITISTTMGKVSIDKDGFADTNSATEDMLVRFFGFMKATKPVAEVPDNSEEVQVDKPVPNEEEVEEKPSERATEEKEEVKKPTTRKTTVKRAPRKTATKSKAE